MMEKSVEVLDLKDIACPMNSAKALLHLEGLEIGAILDILVDDGEPIKNVPLSLEGEGHEILDTVKVDRLWKIRVKKR